MSILIKGVDLPKEGERYHIFIEKGRMRCDKWTNIDRSYMDERYEGNIDTEAIQIDRPHGRLKDTDKLLKEYKQWLESVPYINNTMSEMGQRIVLIDICHDLEYSAPTILEAEE